MSSERLQIVLKELNNIAKTDRKRVKIARAPGRANLIGEHTDYNEGYVLPCTVDRDIIMAATPVDDEVVLHSINLNSTRRFSLAGIKSDPQDHWGNYPKGVTDRLLQSGHEIDGMTGVIHSTIPIEAGLGSSAALEIVTALMFKLLYDVEISPVDLALTCFKAENEFLGVSCGIMDQFASALGRQDAFLFLDCRTLSHEIVDLPSKKLRVVLLNTMVDRAAATILNKRKLECQKAIKVIRRFRPKTKALRDLSSDDFEELKNHLPPTLRKRCQHVVYENERVLEMVKALKKDNQNLVGKLMEASHTSCRNLYEVSCRELDIIVEMAEKISGVVGCRMTGAGFGGCAVCLVWDWAVEELTKRVYVEYRERTGIKPEIYVCSIPPGAGEMLNWNERIEEVF
jgi:galactokinase